MYLNLAASYLWHSWIIVWLLMDILFECQFMQFPNKPFVYFLPELTKQKTKSLDAFRSNLCDYQNIELLKND